MEKYFGIRAGKMAYMDYHKRMMLLGLEPKSIEFYLKHLKNQPYHLWAYLSQTIKEGEHNESEN